MRRQTYRIFPKNDCSTWLVEVQYFGCKVKMVQMQSFLLTLLLNHFLPCARTPFSCSVRYPQLCVRDVTKNHQNTYHCLQSVSKVHFFSFPISAFPQHLEPVSMFCKRGSQHRLILKLNSGQVSGKHILQLNEVRVKLKSMSRFNVLSSTNTLVELTSKSRVTTRITTSIGTAFVLLGCCKCYITEN